MKSKLLIICGPTATGKTKLALHLAKVLGGEIVSADSRQVYRGMDIGTGKDLPVNYKLQIANYKLGKPKIGYYEIYGVKVWGYDLVDPKEEFSVAQYIPIAQEIIKNIWMRSKLPILVGGTGFYIKGVVDGIATSTIPKDEFLRNSLTGKNIQELFEILAGSDSVKAASLNASDRKNPRRLIRAIEIASFQKTGKFISSMIRINEKNKVKNTLFIGLKCSKEVLEGKIRNRVENRQREGIEEEIRELVSQGVNWGMQSMQTLGYSEWHEFMVGRKTKEETLKKWEADEKKYAKRQITWFKKDIRINWFDISQEDWQENVEKLVQKWDNRKYAKEN